MARTTKKLPISLLYVEDKASLRKAYAAVLKEVVEDLHMEENGKAGLKTFNKIKPDLVVTDLNMPEMDGLEMIKEIRKRNKDTRIIIMTAHDAKENFLHAIQHRVRGYLIKPVEHDELASQIRMLGREIMFEKSMEEQLQRRQQAENALKQSDAILKAVNYASELFFKYNYTTQSIADVLKRLGEATNVNRVYIFENFEDNKKQTFTSLLFDWSAPNVKDEVDGVILKEIYYKDGFNRWAKTLKQGKSIHGNIETFPRSEKKLLEKLGLMSIVIMPIFVNNSWWGFIGLDECCTPREWTEAELSALGTAADIIGAAIHRKRVDVELLKFNTELESRIEERTKDLMNEIADRKNIEQLLRESEEKYRLIFENANDGIILTVDGIVRFINPKIYEMTGYMPKHIIGKAFSDFMHIDYRELIMDNHMKRLRGEDVPERYDIKFIDKKGKLNWFEIKSTVITWEGETAVLTFVSDISHRKKTDEEYKKLNRNLEERVQQELKKIKKQQELLIQKSKLESLGELAAGFAHEINQPLGSISLGLDNLGIKLQSGEITDEYYKRKTDSIFRDIERIRNIIQHVRVFSRDQQNATVEPVAVSEVVHNALSLISRQYESKGIDLQVKYSSRNDLLLGNKYKLEQVILNLLSNARYAVTEKEKANIKGYQKTIKITTFANRKDCGVIIHDNGTGIPENILGNIFDPFFTTKQEEMGTGLGLSIIYGIIKEMKGNIKADSKEGKYTRLVVTLPLLKEEKEKHN
ncbi:MAG: response regulator [Bacteroidota bacterium]